MSQCRYYVSRWRLEHEAKHIPNMDGDIIKSIWPHTRSNIEWVGVACIYCEGLDNCIWVCKYDNANKICGYVACCYIPHRESNYYKLNKLVCDDPFSYVCVVNILTYEKINKLLVMGDFNARVGLSSLH